MRRLVIRPGAIGDTIVSLPTLERLCSVGGDVEYAEIWAPERNLPLLRHVAPVRSFSSVQLDLLELKAPPALLNRLRSFDEIVSWYGSARIEFRAALESLGVSFRLFHALPPQGDASEECDHAVDFYLRQCGFDVPTAPPVAPWLPFPHSALAPSRRFIAIHPFSGSAKKNWALESFQAAARELSEASGLAVEWCAGPEEQLSGAKRFEALDEVARWLCKAALYIGNDSGITHLAAACGVATLAIFRSSDAAIWSPRGQHVIVLQAPDPRLVVEAALALLSAAAVR